MPHDESSFDNVPASLQRRREFMERPLAERRKIMERQAEELKEHYEDTIDERDEIQSGEVLVYGE